MSGLLLIVLALALASCISRPSITTVHQDGSISRTSLGTNFMGESDEVLAEIEAPGPIHLRYASKREDATRVPMGYLQALGAKWIAGITGHSQDVKTAADAKLETSKVNADVTKHLSDNALKEATFEPTIPAP